LSPHPGVPAAGAAWIFRQNRWNLQISHIRYRATDDGDCPRIFGSSSAGVAGSFVRTAGTCRSLTSVTARPGDGDCPRSFGSGSAGVAGSFVRTAGTRRSVTFVTEQRMTGTVPAASGVAARVWLDLSSEPLEPADRSHPLQRVPGDGDCPRTPGMPGAGVPGTFVRTAGTCRSVTSVTGGDPVTGTVPAASGVAAAGVPGSFVRTAGTRRSITSVTARDPVTGTVPAASGVAARVWPGTFVRTAGTRRSITSVTAATR
jgi:hypothetical protein